MADFQIDPSYKEVVERIADLKAKHPEATLQPADPTNAYQLVNVGGKDFVVYVAACYRSPDDTRPGIGVAWEPFPGTSNFTRNSELQNAETSAWGRAIVAALASESKAIASANEVRNRQADSAKRTRPTAAAPEPAPATTRRPPPAAANGGTTCATCSRPLSTDPVARSGGVLHHRACLQAPGAGSTGPIPDNGAPASPGVGSTGTGEGEAAHGAPDAAPSPGPNEPSKAQLGKIAVLLANLGVPDTDRHRYVSSLIGLAEPVTSMKALTKRQASAAIEALSAEEAAGVAK